MFSDFCRNGTMQTPSLSLNWGFFLALHSVHHNAFLELSRSILHHLFSLWTYDKRNTMTHGTDRSTTMGGFPNHAIDFKSI